MSEPHSSARPSLRMPSAVLWLLDCVEEFVSSAALVIVVVAASWGVISRYLIQQPATWTGEVATIAFAWCVFIGASAAFKHGGHVSIDMLVSFLSPRMRDRLQFCIDLIVLIFCAYVAALATAVSVDSWDIPTSVLRVPVSVSYLAVACGFALMTVRQGGLMWSRQRPQSS